MKRILLSLGAVVMLSSLSFGGGDIVPMVVPVEAEDDDPCKIYVGVGAVYNRVYATDSAWFANAATQDETAGFMGIIGCDFNEYLAVEGRMSKTFFERDYSDATTWSIFLKPQYKFRDDYENRYDDDEGYFSIYGLIGFGGAYVEGSSGDNDYQAWPNMIDQEMLDTTGFQWGLGISYTFEDESDDRRKYKDTWSIFADYTMSADNADKDPSTLYCYQKGNCRTDATLYDKLSVDGLTVGVIYHF